MVIIIIILVHHMKTINTIASACIALGLCTSYAFSQNTKIGVDFENYKNTRVEYKRVVSEAMKLNFIDKSSAVTYKGAPRAYMEHDLYKQGGSTVSIKYHFAMPTKYSDTKSLESSVDSGPIYKSTIKFKAKSFGVAIGCNKALDSANKSYITFYNGIQRDVLKVKFEGSNVMLNLGNGQTNTYRYSESNKIGFNYLENTITYTKRINSFMVFRTSVSKYTRLSSSQGVKGKSVSLSTGLAFVL